MNFATYWEWLIRGGEAVEITMKDSDWETVKEYASKVAMQTGMTTHQYGKSFFCENADQLKEFLLIFAKSGVRSNTYVGINPRKKIWMLSKKGTTYKGYRGVNVGVACMSNIFVDIDANRKDGTKAATEEELLLTRLCCDDVEKKLEEVFGLRRHIRIFSGNGYQLMYPLHKPLTYKDLAYTKVGEEIVYTESEEFELLKSACRLAIQPAMKGVEKGRAKIDHTWDLRRVGRLPWTRNWKDPSKEIWAAIDKHDDRPSDVDAGERILEIARKHQQHVASGKRTQSFSVSKKEYADINELVNEPLVQLLLSGPLPSGNRNHYLEMQLAILLRDNTKTISPVEEANLLREIGRAQGRPFNAATQYLPRNATFSRNTVNMWCAMERRPPVYKFGLDPMPPIDESKLAQFDAVDMNDVERMFAYHYEKTFKIPLEPSQDAAVIIERMRNKAPGIRTFPFMYACYVRGLVVKEEWEYWRDNWFRFEYAS